MSEEQQSKPSTITSIQIGGTIGEIPPEIIAQLGKGGLRDEEGRYLGAIDQSQMIPNTPPKHEPKNRLTVVDVLYHQIAGQTPVSFPLRFTRILKSDEQLFERNIKVDQEWRPIECGWIKEPSMLLIKNLDKTQRVEIGMDGYREHVISIAYIYPLESLRISPSDMKNLRIRVDSMIPLRCQIVLLPS